LRQGDLLAPFLFLIVAKGLARVVMQAKRNSMLHGLNVGHNKIKINILQFADNTLLLYKPLLENIFVIKSMLRCFELTSGLKVNFLKTKLVGMRVHHYQLLRFVETLNYSTIFVPFIYLDLLAEFFVP